MGTVVAYTTEDGVEGEVDVDVAAAVELSTRPAVATVGVEATARGAACTTAVNVVVGSTNPSFTAVTFTVWGTFQLADVKVTTDGENATEVGRLHTLPRSGHSELTVQS